ncbi:YARHG domain-containing protein [Fibrobacter intestinalis]|uniref:YARHG domain-containing protein n=1 Tax=Fibrobacter intestinalis TaxID=28122 RepID=A0A1T4QB49_9BACT|nr:MULTISPECIES: YARHG domain-containing protein [Fibrobacter]PBC74567.1 YARHG domain-containing protein [Fibrobacter sp. NR9]SKA00458.1 YARHG domain-containing protein [Fibrobacter intestinalis]
MIRIFSFISNKSLALLFFMSSLLFVACKSDEEKCKEGDWEACGREIVNVAMENFQRGLNETVKTKKDGKFTDYYSNGNMKIKGAYKDGMKHGRWRKWDSEGNLIYDGSFKYGEKEGFWQEIENGIESKGKYKGGKRFGLWEETSPLSQAKGSYVNGKRDGFWEESYDGETYKGNYKNDEKDGVWDENGEKIRYKNGKVVSESNNKEQPKETFTNSSHPVIGEALFANLSKHRLSGSDLSSYTKSELRILRNSIFAKHGYIFKSEDLKMYFSQFEWYKPEFNNVNHKLNSVEKENIKILKQAEDNGNLSSLANIRDWQIV